MTSRAPAFDPPTHTHPARARPTPPGLPNLSRVVLSVLRALRNHLNSCYGDYCNCEGVRPADGAKNNGRVGHGRELNGRSSSGALRSNLVPYRSILRSRAEEKALSLRPRPKPQTSASTAREAFERTLTPGDGLVDLSLRAPKVRCIDGCCLP